MLKQARKYQGALWFRFDDPSLVPWASSFAENVKPHVWRTDLSSTHLDTLREKGFLFSKALKIWERENYLPIQGMKIHLYPFQVAGVRFLEEQQGRAILGDEMGLGKTIQSIAFLQLHPELRPTVVVCPASLKLNWQQEIRNCTTGNVVRVLFGQKSRPLPNRNCIYLINYDIIQYWLKHLLAIQPKALILDEFQKIKDPRRKRSKACLKLGKVSGAIIGLSGTPVRNKPVELFPILSLLKPEQFSSYWSFAMRYGKPRKTPWGWKFEGCSHAEELHEILKSVMIRRKKEEVLKDLPAMTSAVVPVEISNKRDYQSIERDFMQWLQANSSTENEGHLRTEAMGMLSALRQTAAIGKMKFCVQWIEDFLESGEKLVLFTCHKIIMKTLEDHFKGRCVKIDGSVPTSHRQQIVKTFQENPKIPLFLGNIQAAAEGITLTAASNCAFVEFPWVPTDIDQAAARIHRIGQKAQGVTAWYVVASNTIEERILEATDRKRAIISQVVDGKEIEQEDLIMDVIRSYRKNIESKRV